ncbi:MAG: putative alcohol dehydrogenase AdhA [Acidimicrobiales bacterium]|nr:MAG: zinc-binding alcohol dehydrogenase family protein [Actinomycetota bacterium]MBV6509855.1 putative alcohol dehydrogenase AdhA [Acidimicrobiales bacterium]RIK06206.1 MAG: alcohol dehydrogenase [Acidobacteriota bacterium]
MARAQILERPAPADSSPLKAVTVADLDIAPDEVLIDVAACGVCRTDLQLCEGDLRAHQLPIVPGHQIVGTVAAIGSEVSPHRLGERVGVAWIASACGICRYCTRGLENLCDHAAFTGWDRDGGFAERVTARSDFAYPLPDDFSDMAAAPLLCGGVIGYRALGIAGVEPGQRIGLYGFGSSATSVIQIAVHWGCEVFVATRSRHEQQRALDLGAAWAAGYDQEPPAPLDAAITFAPVGDVAIRALEALDKGGTLAINAIHLDRIPEFSYDLLWEERSIRSVANVTRRDIVELLELAIEIPIVSQTQEYALDDANRALLDLREGRVSGSAVLRM